MKILLVEDEVRLAKTIRKGLEMERYIVDIAYRGDDGYDLAMTEEYDLIILDIMLPGMDGIQVCKSLRQHKKTTPILMLTAKSLTRDKVAGLDTGADDYLTKPFDFEELLARIRAVSRRPHNVAPSIVDYADLHVDFDTRQVKREGKTIDLSPKEFLLFTYLLKYKNSVVSKEQIMRNVWEYDADILPNTVEASIKNLRKKIDLPFHGKPALIRTRRGFGYLFSLPEYV